ncbi:MAG: hypothetical protein CL432_08950 [Acidimicrobiaceae bacterium]|nr:hypothetical protein [Acidimicrobiaceae bacterium]|tara:strand:- start:541 stop:795 length:255 start_codon:yes stop_codon:yes gene_type:complete
MNKIQTEDPRFVRDMHSKALLSTDREALNRHRLERMAAKKHQEEVDAARAAAAENHEQIMQLRSTVDKIEELLNRVIEKDNNGS